MDMVEEMVHWEGAGWYASQIEWGRVRTFALGVVNPQAYDEASVAARARNLGTPEWLDTVPGWCEMGGEMNWKSMTWDEVQIAEIDLDMPEVQIAAESGQAGIGLILFIALIVFLVIVAVGVRLPFDLMWLPRAMGF